MPFLSVHLTPIIMDELAGTRDIHRLILYAALLIGGECVMAVLRQLTVIALHAPLLLAVCFLCVLVSGWMSVLNNKVEVKAYEGLSKTNRFFSYFGWENVELRFS